MMSKEGFFSAEESALSDEFLERGYLVRDVDDRPSLDALRSRIVELACRHLGAAPPANEADFLDHVHQQIAPDRLNDLRLFVFRAINEWHDLRPTYYKLGRSLLWALVGNELAMQNRVNLSIQMSRDDSSLLDIHSDVYGGESPFQVVQWLPLVDVARTKSMFILPHEKTREISRELNSVGSGGMQALYARVEPNLIWLDVPYGKVLVFASHCLHGNVVNREDTTRWSLNCRFKGLFTPYTSHEKKLGSFYLPITTRPASRFGMQFEAPTGFAE